MAAPIPESSRITGLDEDPSDVTMSVPPVPQLFTSLPPIKDDLETESSQIQDSTVEEILPWMTLEQIENPEELNSHGVPVLQRSNHIKFFKKLDELLPPPYVAADATRPWMVYWALAGLGMLGGEISEYEARSISTFVPCQHPDGGFGAGTGFLAHLATSYATILSLAMIGSREAFDLIDRKSLWHWIGRMKQKDGGFTVCEGGEEDIRGAYCAMTIISILSLPLELPPDSPARIKGDETFMSGLPEWISSIQMFDGGIAGSPTSEGHGAYAFCALACLALIDSPDKIIPRYLDVPALIRCLSARQYAPEGGFSGRPNKLVDACYSHWVGGCWSLLSASLGLVATDLWNREALYRYIMCCCQAPEGGLRDKPSKHPDGYHSCYSLAGISACQYIAQWDPKGAEHVAGNPLTSAYGWRIKGVAVGPWEEKDLIQPVHPIFVIPLEKATRCREYFENTEKF